MVTAVDQLGIEPFVRTLIRAGVPNVVGWDGSVYDRDAIGFARPFYRELAAFGSVPYAAAIARREVLQAHRTDPNTGHHWHLARAYAGQTGGGKLCGPGKPKRKFRKGAGFREFLDKAAKRVPVATARQFVGRRRLAQAVLRAFRDEGGKSGVLLFGMGNIGKSSLAARIANRMPNHKTVVIYDRYDALAIFDGLMAALSGADRMAWEGEWRQAVADNGAMLGNVLEDLLDGPFDDRPILLVIDDLEQVLAQPQPGEKKTPVKDAPGARDTWRLSLGCVLRAFGAARTASRLLLTSRYLFTLPDGHGGDLADLLEPIQLLPMAPRERNKQWQAALRAEEGGEAPSTVDDPVIINRILEVASGNPGLQEILCRPVLAGEIEAAESAVDAVADWKDSGNIPEEESAAQEFFQRISFETYGRALTDPQYRLLRASTLFSEDIPVPFPALVAVGSAAGVDDPEAAIVRMLGLGLIDDWEEIDDNRHVSANPLARPLVTDKLTNEEKKGLAGSAVGPISKAWRNEKGVFPYDRRAVEAAVLAIIGDASSAVIERAAIDAGYVLFNREHNAKAALEILEAAREKLAVSGYQLGPKFILLASNCAGRIGERELQVELLEQGLGLESGDKLDLARIAATHATMVLTHDNPERAMKALRQASALFEEADSERDRAVTMGKIADILAQRGETEEALRIRREEQLPVYERLGEVRSRAVTMGKIADILAQRGETEEALRIRREEQLPVYERLGEVRSRAVTMGQIADILAQRGETEEALRIRREEQLPVYERLGDVRSRAVTMGKIADILAQRGETEEALRIRREEQLPVYERLGEVRSRAVTMGQIADILAQRGETEEALRIRREEELPVYERLGDVRSRAVTMGKIADILAQRGETDEALRIRREEELPVFERLGDVRDRAVTMGKIADILAQRGETEEALRIRREEELPVFERLGDVRERAVTMGKIADILAQRGEIGEALKMLSEECLPIFESVGDPASISYVRFRCAMIKLNKGGIQQEEIRSIYEDLNTSFQISLRLQHTAFVAVQGEVLGQVMALGGLKEKAVEVLEISAKAYEQLQRSDKAEAVRKMMGQIQEES